MRHRIAIAAFIAVAALVIGACEDRDRGGSQLFTEPAPGESGSASGHSGYVTTGVAAVNDPRTHRLQDVRLSSSAPAGVSASVVAGRSTGDAIQIANGSPALGTGVGSKGLTFVDPSSHTHAIVFLYPRIGGPPAAMQHYIDGALASTTAYTWLKTPTGWIRQRGFLQVVRNGTLYGTYTTTTVPAKPGSGGGPPEMVRLDHGPQGGTLQRLLGGAAYGLAFALAPQDASAQVSPAFGACLQEWLKYAAAAAVVVGIEAVIAEAPVLTPLLMAQLAAALALLAAAEDALLNCVLSHQPSFGAGLSGGSGSGAGSGGGSYPAADCLEGSYAAHCTTAFTL